MELRAQAHLLAAVLLMSLSATASLEAADPATRLRETREAARLLMDLAALPSFSGDAAGAAQAARWIQERFKELGFETRTLGEEGNPLVLAERKADPAAPTVLFYMHYDTQPTGPREDWGSTGGEPFTPRLLSGRWDAATTRPIEIADLSEASLGSARLYGRGVADDKAPIVMHLGALRRWLGGPNARRLHLKYLFDGEEEAGSPHIAASLERFKDLLRADLLVLCDGPMDALGRHSVYLGTRGDMHMRLRVRTASVPAHSGNYSLLPNAAFRLAALLATMKDRTGNITVDGLMDDVVAPTAAEREVLSEASLAEPAILEELGVAKFEGDASVPYYERLLFHPSLIINQLASGRPGNQIPVTAEALLEVRLVTRQDPMSVFDAVRRHVRARLPEAELEYLDGTPAARMDPTDPTIKRALAAVTIASGGKVLAYPTLGGTLPLLATFSAAGHRYLGLPLVNFDDNQHVGNENLRLSVLAEGADLLVRFLDALSSL